MNEALATQARVDTLDLPGCGKTRPMKTAARTAGIFAVVVGETLAKLGLTQAAVYGIGFGSSIALETAGRLLALVNRNVLQAVLLPSEEERKDLQANHSPPIAL